MAFNGSLKNVETHYRIYEESQARSIALSSIEKPMADCEKTLKSLQDHLESENIFKKFTTGARFDTVLEKHLNCLKNSRNLFHELLQVDQTVILHVVERYNLNCAKDIRDLQKTIGEIDGRSRRDFEQVHRSLGSIYNVQKEFLCSHEDSRAQRESQARAQKDSTIIDWLCPFNFGTKQSDVFRSRSGFTGTWVLETEEFKDWTIGSGKTLWCTGIPGAGKTVFTSIVVEHLEQIDPGAAISYVYCSYKDEANQTPANLFASILQQILTTPPSVSDGLRALYDHHEPKHTRPTIEELSVQLQAYVCNLKKFFVVIDALDECPAVKREEFLNHVRKLQPAVNLMITTRPASHVVNGFPDAACVEIQAKDTDIQSYCKEKIRSDRRLHFVQDDAALMDVAITTIAKNAQKMFLLAVLHIESLVSRLNKAQVRNALEKLPKGLDDTYREALQRIDCQGQPSREMAYQVLSWISYAYRPLTIEELQCALAVTPGSSTFDEDAMTPESTLVSVCAGLVAVDPQSRIIRLVHYTAQEIFEKNRDSKIPTAQTDITLTCLTCLSFDHPNYEYSEYWNKFPFLLYAKRYWRDHMRAVPETDKNYVNEAIIQILLQPRRLQILLHYTYNHERPVLGPLAHIAHSKVPPLCAAAILGMESVVVLLLERGADSIKSVIGDGETALHTAAYFSQLEMMKILIDRGTSVNGHVWTPLSGAISSIFFFGNGMDNEGGAVAAARLLLDRGADIDLQSDYMDGYTITPLIQAAMTGSVQLVDLLLTYGADVTLRFRHGLTVLHEAHSGKPGMFQLLVDHGADLHARDDDGESPLLRLCHDHNREPEDTVRVLLRLGADIHSRNNLGETPLFRAAERGFCRMIEVLMEYGADIHARNKFGRSVIFSAIDTPYRGAERVVPTLLRFGADVHLQDSAGYTALGLAAAKGLDGTVKLILDHKSNIDICNEAGDTAFTLAAAAKAGWQGSRLFDGKGPLGQEIRMAGAMERNLKILEILLDQGANMDLKNKAGDTALTQAAAKGKLDAVKLLLNHGADAHAKNEAGDTALSLASQYGHPEVHQLLLEHLSEPNQPPVPTEVE